MQIRCVFNSLVDTRNSTETLRLYIRSIRPHLYNSRPNPHCPSPFLPSPPNFSNSFTVSFTSYFPFYLIFLLNQSRVMPTATTNSSSSRQQQNALFVHTSPTDFLAATQTSLLAHERRANIILPHAEKLKAQEQSGTLAPGQFWITAWSTSPPNSLSTPSAHRGPHLDFVLACTEGHMGTYPLFLFSTHDIVSPPEQWLDQYMHQLAQKLMTLVDPARVFSIFGQERAVQMLCSHWSTMTGFHPVSQPYYEASSTYCTPETFVPSRSTPEPGHVMRKAVPSDLDQVARLCQEFAEDSVSRHYSRLSV